MNIELKKFLRKPFPVDAVQVTIHNMHAVAAWCEGAVEMAPASKGRPPAPFIQVPVVRPRNDFHTRAYLSDWVLKAGEGYKVYTDKSLHANFDEFMPDFPQTDGVFITDKMHRV